MCASARFAIVFVVASAALASTSCAPQTRVVAAWKRPDVSTVALQRSIVVFQHKSDALRRSIEDEVARQIPGAVAAYTIIPTEELRDVERVREDIERGGFDSVIVQRLVASEQRVDVVPGAAMPSYGYAGYPGYGLWGAWGPTWSTVYSPTYLDEVTVLTLETQVYSLDPRFGSGEGELVFTNRSETFDAANTDALAKSVAKASLRSMEKEGLVVLTNPVPATGRGR